MYLSLHSLVQRVRSLLQGAYIVGSDVRSNRLGNTLSDGQTLLLRRSLPKEVRCVNKCELLSKKRGIVKLRWIQKARQTDEARRKKIGHASRRCTNKAFEKKRPYTHITQLCVQRRGVLYIEKFNHVSRAGSRRVERLRG